MEKVKNEGIPELQKKLEIEISKMEKEIQEIPEIKKDIIKSFLILVISVVMAILMKNVLGLHDWWLVVISSLNVISVIAMYVLIRAFLKWYYLKGIAEIIERIKEKEKK